VVDVDALAVAHGQPDVADRGTAWGLLDLDATVRRGATAAPVEVLPPPGSGWPGSRPQNIARRADRTPANRLPPSLAGAMLAGAIQTGVKPWVSEGDRGRLTGSEIQGRQGAGQVDRGARRSQASPRSAHRPLAAPRCRVGSPGTLTSSRSASRRAGRARGRSRVKLLDQRVQAIGAVHLAPGCREPVTLCWRRRSRHTGTV